MDGHVQEMLSPLLGTKSLRPLHHGEHETLRFDTLVLRKEYPKYNPLLCFYYDVTSFNDILISRIRAIIYYLKTTNI